MKKPIICRHLEFIGYVCYSAELKKMNIKPKRWHELSEPTRQFWVEVANAKFNAFLKAEEKTETKKEQQTELAV